MRKLALPGMAAVLAFLVACGAAQAQTSWDGTAGLLRVQEAGTIGRGQFVFSLGTAYQRWPDETLLDFPGSFYERAGGTDPKTVSYNFFLSRAGIALGLSDNVEIAAALDVRNWIMQVPAEFESDDFETFYRGGLGDTRVSTKLCLPLPGEMVRLGLLASAGFPTGKKEYRFSTDAIEFGLDGLVTLDLTKTEKFVPTKLHLNAGYAFNRNEDEGYGILNTSNPNLSGFYPPAYPPAPPGEGNRYNDVFRLGTGVEFLLENSRLFVEFRWDNLLHYDAVAPEDSPLRNKNMYTITPGFSVVSRNGVGVQLGLDINLNSESNRSIMNPPEWMAYFGLSLSRRVVERDSDGDGVPDGIDRCPDTPAGAKVDKWGCPIDSDGDGVPDGIDRCPDTPAGAIVDEWGCPIDSDGDGVPDGIDRCPDTPAGAKVDEWGCPIDSDGDGVPDGIDRCSDTPAGAIVDEWGCPEEKVIEERFILRGINFETASAALRPESFAILDQVVRSLAAYPEVRVEIRGYTDSVGDWDYNLKLSERRAESVKQYLVNSGIAAGRLVARGFGEADPIASNSTAEGRAENRRIEFHRLN